MYWFVAHHKHFMQNFWQTLAPFLLICDKCVLRCGGTAKWYLCSNLQQYNCWTLVLSFMWQPISHGSISWQNFWISEIFSLNLSPVVKVCWTIANYWQHTAHAWPALSIYCLCVMSISNIIVYCYDQYSVLIEMQSELFSHNIKER